MNRIFESKEYKDFIELLDISRGRYKKADVFKDLITTMALKISNSIKYDGKNEKYCSKIMEKYSEGEEIQFVILSYRLSKIYNKCTEIIDVLGHIYTDISLNKKGLKQDFTPKNLANLMAEIQVKLGNDKKTIKEKGFVIIEDSCCGSGVLLLERANAMKKEGIDTTSELLVIANDIDPICAYMTYVQLYIYSIPGVVTIGNPLQLETKETFYTHKLLAIDLNFEQGDTEEKEIEE